MAAPVQPGVHPENPGLSAGMAVALVASGGFSMHVRSMVVALSGSLLLVGCGGSGGSGNNTPTSPSPTSGGAGSTVVTINIMGDKGTLSFSPNPATIPAGQ